MRSEFGPSSSVNVVVVSLLSWLFNSWANKQKKTTV